MSRDRIPGVPPNPTNSVPGQELDPPMRNSSRAVGRIGTGVGTLLGCLALAVLASGATAFPAVSPVFPGATLVVANTHSALGCGQAHLYVTHWSNVSGIGHLHSITSARSCPAWRASPSSSFGQTTQELQVSVPVKLSNGSGGLNVTWALDDRAFANTSLGATSASNCVAGFVSSTTSGPSYNRKTVTNTTSYCVVVATWSIDAVAYLVDSTTSRFDYGQVVSAGPIGNTTSLTEIVRTSTTNYSNPAAWRMNASVAHYRNYTNSSSVYPGPTWSPEWFINGTFRSSDRYTVVTWIDVTEESEVGQILGGDRASTYVDLASPGHFAELLPFSIW